MGRSTASMLIWMIVIFVATAAVTVASYVSLIMPEDRHDAFYVALVSTCVAELLLFAYIPFVLTARETTTRPSPAVRMRILLMIIVWLVAILVGGAVAAAPGNRDTFFSDKILLMELAATLLLFMAAFFLHRQDVVIQVKQAAPHAERVRFQHYGTGIDSLLNSVRSLSTTRPQRIVELERLSKRLDTLKTHLLSISPKAERDSDRLVEPVPVEDIERRLKDLHEQVGLLSAVTEDKLGERIGSVCQLVDGAIAALRHREDTLVF